MKILVIDEILFMCNDQLQVLDKRLKEMRDRTNVFGGYSIIFAVDFRKLETSGSSDNNLLYSSQSSNLYGIT